MLDQQSTLSRRQAITAATAAAIIPTSASASIVDPHPAWLEEWRALDPHYWALEPSADSQRLAPELQRLSDLILDTPAVTRDGMIAKLRHVREIFGGEEQTDTPIAVLIETEQFLGALS